MKLIGNLELDCILILILRKNGIWQICCPLAKTCTIIFRDFTGRIPDKDNDREIVECMD